MQGGPSNKLRTQAPAESRQGRTHKWKLIFLQSLDDPGAVEVRNESQ